MGYYQCPFSCGWQSVDFSECSGLIHLGKLKPKLSRPNVFFFFGGGNLFLFYFCVCLISGLFQLFIPLQHYQFAIASKHHEYLAHCILCLFKLLFFCHLLLRLFIIWCVFCLLGGPNSYVVFFINAAPKDRLIIGLRHALLFLKIAVHFDECW